LETLKKQGKTIRVKARTFASGEVEDTEGARKKRIEDLEKVLKDLNKTKEELETAAKNMETNQKWLQRIKDTKFGTQAPAQVQAEEKKLEKTQEQIEAERDAIERNLAMAQTRLRLAQRDYNAKAQRRGGKKKRSQTRKNRQ
jgi:hypothetical protein